MEFLKAKIIFKLSYVKKYPKLLLMVYFNSIESKGKNQMSVTQLEGKYTSALSYDLPLG